MLDVLCLALLTLPTEPSLESSLAAVDARKLRADIEFLASDELAGRDSPSEGLRVAARYLRSRLVRAGWQPGAGDRYLSPYWLATRAVDPEGTTLGAQSGRGAEAFVFGQDYFFSSRTACAATFEGGVVFCGTGGVRGELDGLDLDGRWALFWDDGETNWRIRRKRAQDVGALGVITAPGPGYADEPYAERYGDWARRAARGSVTWPEADDRENRTYPFLYLTRAAAERLVALSGRTSLAVGDELGVTVRDRRELAGHDGRIELENVCGLWPGSDPELAREVIVLSAHYDHVGVDSRGRVFNGADDNASGTTTLLGVCDALAAHGPLPRSVLLIWVSAEEKGLLGSRAWTTYPWLPDGHHPILNVNIDMIGRNAPDNLLVTPTSRHAAYNGLTKLVEELAPQEGFTDLGSADDYWERSDQKNFKDRLGLPACFLFSDVHEDYHQPGDDAEKIDFDKLWRVARLVVRMVFALQEPDTGLAAPPADDWLVARARGDLLALAKACEAYAREHGSWPGSLELLVEPSGEDGATWLGRGELPTDPWGTPYLYDAEAGVVRCLGADGKPGGRAADEDLLSSELP